MHVTIIPKIFISYSHDDEYLKDEFIKHLMIYQNKQMIKIWHDRKIDPGMEWHEEITKELNSCDIAVLLISQNFMNSHFINHEEFIKFVDRSNKGEVYIFPIYLRHCNWSIDDILSSLQMLPRDNKPIESFTTRQGKRNKVLSEIANEIAEISKRFVMKRSHNAAPDQDMPDVEPINVSQNIFSLNANLISTLKIGELKIFPYSDNYISDIISYYSSISIEALSSNSIITYLKEYLQILSVSTIVIEENYKDKEYLESYLHFYYNCLRNYKKYCVRLHFFKENISIDTFAALLSTKKSENLTLNKLKQCYVGFVVIKPLPHSPIGTTCLTIPSSKEFKRQFLMKSYPISLFGIDLISKTVPFLPSDNKIVRHGITAIYSLLQTTEHLFNYPSLSPLGIEKIIEKSFPSIIERDGISLREVIIFLKEFGFMSYDQKPINLNLFKLFIYIFLNCNIPVLLGINIYDVSKTGDPLFLGNHLVTVVGFSMDENLPVRGNPSLISSRIDKIYVHDDQVGPFSKMAFDINEQETNDFSQRFMLSLSWLSILNDKGFIKAEPVIAIAPLRYVIKFPHTEVVGIIISINELISALNELIFKDSLIQVEWSILIGNAENFKTEVYENYTDIEIRNLILLRPMPPVFWRVIAYYNNNRVIELLFDTSESELEYSFFLAIEHDKEVGKLIRETINTLKETNITLIKNFPCWMILKWFIENQ